MKDSNMPLPILERHEKHMKEAMKMYDSLFAHGIGSTFNITYSIERDVTPIYVFGRSTPIDMVTKSKQLVVGSKGHNTFYSLRENPWDSEEIFNDVLMYFCLLSQEHIKAFPFENFHAEGVLNFSNRFLEGNLKYARFCLPNTVSFYWKQTSVAQNLRLSSSFKMISLPHLFL